MFEESSTLYALLNPLFRLTSMLGLSPFHIDEQEVRESKLALVWCIFWMVSLTMLSLFALIVRPHKSYGFIMKVGDVIQVYMNVISMFSVFLCCCLNRKTICKSLRDLFQLDKELEGFGIDLSRIYKSSRGWILVAMVSISLYNLGTVIVNMWSYYVSWNMVYVGSVVAYVFPSIVNTFMELQFGILVVLLNQRFRWLNGKFLEIGEVLRKPWPKGVGNYEKLPLKGGTDLDGIMRVLEKIRVHHHQLCKIGRQINAAYSVQLLLLVLTTFLTVVMTLFYWAIRSTDETGKIGGTAADEIYINNEFVLAIVEVLVVIFVCSATSSEARRAGSLIHDLMPPSEVLSTKRPLQIQLSSFSLQLTHSKMEFDACGVFIINESLLYSIVGAAAAYLVIVVQFELANYTAKNVNRSMVSNQTVRS